MKNRITPGGWIFILLLAHAIIAVECTLAHGLTWIWVLLATAFLVAYVFAYTMTVLFCAIVLLPSAGVVRNMKSK